MSLGSDLVGRDVLAGLVHGRRTTRAVVGTSGRNLVWRTILPKALPPLVVAATLAVGAAILFESGLAFLRLAVPDTMSWGAMAGLNRYFALEAWWTVLPSGLSTLMTVLGVSLVGEGVTDALHP